MFAFLGSLRLAILLIASTAALTVAGTLIESTTGSHLQAAQIIYNHPLFLILLCGYFINILFSALNRWPFKKNHIPFLITHFGMLMVLAGAMAKNLLGLQGSMLIWEGGTSDQVLVKEKPVIAIEKREPYSRKVIAEIPAAKGVKSPFPSLTIDIKATYPHSTHRFDTWIKDGKASISGVSPLDLTEITDLKQSIPPATKALLQGRNGPEWTLFALKSDDFDAQSLAEAVYGQQGEIALTQSYLGDLLWKGSIAELLNGVDGFKGELLWDGDPILRVIAGEQWIVEMPLSGTEKGALINRKTPYLGSAPFAVEVAYSPTLVLIEDKNQSHFLYFFDSKGGISSKQVARSDLDTLLVYDEGFGGYAVSATLPAETPSYREKLLKTVEEDLRSGIKEAEPLSPPLELIAEGAQHVGQEPAAAIVAFLDHWDRSGQWLFPEHLPLSPELDQVVQRIDWKKVPPERQAVCGVLADLFHQLDPLLNRGQHPLTLLKEIRWPLVDLLAKQTEERELLQALTQQVIAGTLSSDWTLLLPKEPISTGRKARFLSAYLRTCGIHLTTAFDPLSLPHHDENGEEIETVLAVRHEPAPPLKVLEENRSMVQATFTEGTRSETITLGFDPTGKNLKWPVLDGKYLASYRPQIVILPYLIRIREARQVSYPGSTQAYSYECDLRCTDKKTGRIANEKISMNHVYESPEGYRFYLSNITEPKEGSVKQIHLIVNYDPLKYMLTYPGGLLMALGILLLFGSSRLKS